MTNKDLYLIGSVHVDLKGPKRLEGILKWLSPDIIALEFHKESEPLIEQRKSMNSEEEKIKIDNFLKEVGISPTQEERRTMLEVERDIRSVIGYEFTVCRDYTHANPNSRLEYIDIPLSENVIQEFGKWYNTAIESMPPEIVQKPELRKSFLETLSRGKKDYLRQFMKEVDNIYQDKFHKVCKAAELMRDPKILEEEFIRNNKIPPNAVCAIKHMFDPKRDEFMANRIKELYNNGLHRLVAVTGLMHLPGIKSRILKLKPRVMTLADFYTPE